MSTEIKISEEILAELQQLSNEITQNIISVGKANIDIKFREKYLESAKENLESLYANAEDLSKKEIELEDKIIKLYGRGTLDVSTGTLTPIENEVAQ